MYFDTLYRNGKIYTMDDAVPKADWVATKGGKIAALGNGVHNLIEAARTIDLQGKVMFPGFIDSHMHGTPTGAYLGDFKVQAAASVQEVIDIVAEACKVTGSSWIFGSGLNISGLIEGRGPSRQELDKVSGDHPVYIKNVTLHGCTINSKAYELVDIPKDMNGIVKDKAGILTGEFSSDESTFYVSNIINSLLSDFEVEKYIKKCADFCVSQGLTTISGLDGGLFDKTDRDFFMWMNMKDMLPLHIVNFFQNENVYLAMALGLPRIGGCLCLDGAGFEGTMATRDSYNNGPYPSGILYWTDERLYKFLWTANKNGLQTAMHALGDAAIDQYLRVYERVYTELGLQGNPNHNRIEHFTLVWPEQIDKAISLGLILSMQPMFTYQWENPNTELGRGYELMLGKVRAERMEPFAEILSKGGIIAGGSDSPVTLTSPLNGIHAACNLANQKKRISVKDAIKLFTVNGAIANWQENEKGSITVGKLADLVVIDRDPFEEPELINQFIIEKTIVEDKVVYTKEAGVQLDRVTF